MSSSSSINRFSLVIILIFVWVGHFFVDVMIGIWPVYKSMVHLDLAKAGLVVAVGAFIGEGSQLFFGTLSDRGYRKLIISIGVLAASSSVFLAYSTNYFVLFAIYLVTCIGSGAFHPSSAGLVNTLVPERRGLLMTIFASGGSLGLATSQLIFTSSFKAFDGHTYFLAFPGLILIGLFALYRFPQALTPKRSPTEHKRRMRDSFLFFKQADMRNLYISQVANQALLWGTIFILPDVLKTLGHFEWICYGGGHLCLILGGAMMMVPSGYLADRYSARQVLLYSSFISMAVFYFILLTGGISMTLVLISLFVLGASLAIANPIAVALGNRYVSDQPGAVSAFLMGLVWCLSEAIGPGGVGIMSSWFADYAPVKALALLGCFFPLNIYATLRLPKKLPVSDQLAVSLIK